MPQVESRQHGAGAAQARVTMHGDDFVGRQQPINALTKSDCLLQRRRVHVRHRIRRPADPELCGQRRLYRFFRERDQVCHTDCAERVEVITDGVDGRRRPSGRATTSGILPGRALRSVHQLPD